MIQRNARLLPPFAIALAIFLAAGSPAKAASTFNAYQIGGTNSDIIVADLNGDGLQDLLLVNGLDLGIYFQDSKQGFTHEPQQACHLDAKPSLICAARLGGAADSVLVMTSDGVEEWSFSGRTNPPARHIIIRQNTILPDSAEETNAVYLPFTAATAGGWPLVLVPTAGGIQVWQHQDDWRLAQTIGHSVNLRLQPAVMEPGYNQTLSTSFSVSDVNGDGRDDLAVCEPLRGTNTYRIYLQQTNGLFSDEPALTYAVRPEPFSYYHWIDLNHDGRVDLVKGVWPNEPSFIPGVPAAKVFVSLYTADAEGRIPAEPQQVFRKDDWNSEVPLVDLDGDGYPDLVLGYNRLESKESVIKEISARRLDYVLRFFYYRPGTGYPSTADGQCNVVIHIDHDENFMDWTLPENFARYVHLGGDFTGSGKINLLVRERGDDIAAYPFVSRERGFNTSAAVRFNCPEPIDSWQIADLNHDGISDLIVKLADHKGLRVFISRKQP